MTTLRHLRAEDRLPEEAKPPGGVLDTEELTGRWLATDHQAAGVVRLELSRRDGALFVRAFGANGAQPYDWGEIEAMPYGSSVVATEAMAFSAIYDFGFLVTILAAYAKQGILVLDTFNTFTDSSGRSNYFSREFFHR